MCLEIGGKGLDLAAEADFARNRRVNRQLTVLGIDLRAVGSRHAAVTRSERHRGMIRIAIAVAVNRGVRRIHCRTGLDVGGRLGRYALGRHIEAPLRCDRVQLHVAGRIKLHVVAIRDIHLARELVVRVGEVDVTRPGRRTVASTNRDLGVTTNFDMVAGYITHSRHLLRKVAVDYLNIKVGSSADFAELKVVVVLYCHALRGIEVDGRAEVILQVIEDNVAVNRLEGRFPSGSYILRGYSALGDVTFPGGHAERTLRVNATEHYGILVDKLDVGALGSYRLVVLEGIADIVERYITAARVTSIGGREGRRVLGCNYAGLGDVARTGREIERTVCGERTDYEAAGGVDDRDGLALALDRADRVRLGSERDVIGRAAKRKSRRVDDLPVCGSRLFGATVERKRAGVDRALRLGELAADRDVLGRLSNHCVSDGSACLPDRAGDFEIGPVAIKLATCGGLRDITGDLLRVDRAGTVLDDGRRLDAVGAGDRDSARAVLRNRHAGGVDRGGIDVCREGRVLRKRELLCVDRTGILVKRSVDLDVLVQSADRACAVLGEVASDFRRRDRAASLGQELVRGAVVNLAGCNAAGDNLGGALKRDGAGSGGVDTREGDRFVAGVERDAAIGRTCVKAGNRKIGRGDDIGRSSRAVNLLYGVCSLSKRHGASRIAILRNSNGDFVGRDLRTRALLHLASRERELVAGGCRACEVDGLHIGTVLRRYRQIVVCSVCRRLRKHEIVDFDISLGSKLHRCGRARYLLDLVSALGESDDGRRQVELSRLEGGACFLSNDSGIDCQLLAVVGRNRVGTIKSEL